MFAYHFWNASEERHCSLGYFICAAVIEEVDKRCIDFMFYAKVPGQSIGTWNVYTADSYWSTFLETQSEDMRDTTVTDALDIKEVDILIQR